MFVVEYSIGARNRVRKLVVRVAKIGDVVLERVLLDGSRCSYNAVWLECVYIVARVQQLVLDNERKSAVEKVVHGGAYSRSTTSLLYQEQKHTR